MKSVGCIVLFSELQLYLTTVNVLRGTQMMNKHLLSTLFFDVHIVMQSCS